MKQAKICTNNTQLLYFFLLAGLLVMPVYAQNANTSSEGQRKGQEYFEKGIEAVGQAQYTNAIALFNLSLKFDNRNYEAYYNLGVAQQNTGYFDQAIRNYSYALELSSGQEQALVFSSRGTAFAANQDYDKAIADYNRALALDPENAAIYANRGLSFSAKGNNQAAILDFSTALVLDPRYSAGYSGRGIVYYHTGDLAAALADYNSALEYSPEDVVTLFNRALLFRDQKQLDQGINDLNTTLDLLDRKPELVQGANTDLRSKCEIALKELQRQKEAEGRYTTTTSTQNTDSYRTGAPNPNTGSAPAPSAPSTSDPFGSSSDNPFGSSSSNPFGGGGAAPF